MAAAAGLTPLLFFSRRIGLNSGAEVPIDAGGRLTGKVGAFTLGVVDVRTGDTGVDADNQLLGGARQARHHAAQQRRLLYTGRSNAVASRDSSQAFGVDAAIGLYDNWSINAYYAKSDTPAVSDQDSSYRAQVSYNGDRYGMQYEKLLVDDHFSPEVGFLPGPRSIASSVRSASVRGRAGRNASANTHTPPATTTSRTRKGASKRATRTSPTASPSRTETASTRMWRAGTDLWRDRSRSRRGSRCRWAARLRRRDRRVRARQPAQSIRDDHRLAWHLLRWRSRCAQLHERPYRTVATLLVEPGLSFNWVDLVEGRFTTELLSNRTTFTVTPRHVRQRHRAIQLSITAVSSNLRLRWENRPAAKSSSSTPTSATRCSPDSGLKNIARSS